MTPSPERWKRDIFLVIRVTILVCAVRAGLWLVSFWTLRGIVAFLANTRTGRTTQVSVEELSKAVSGVSRFVPQATCLTQALTLHILLRRRRLESKIHIGVAKTKGGPFESHAWVENEGRVVIGDFDLNRFTPMMVWQ
jgi:Transglutaminase-like superfamily